MISQGNTFLNSGLVRHLRLAFRSATIKNRCAEENNTMAKKQATKTKVEEPDPIGDLMTPEFIERSFKKAVKRALEENRQLGLDSYGTRDGKLVAVKPDGRVEPVVSNPKKNHG
jgi:hypothetical protein